MTNFVLWNISNMDLLITETYMESNTDRAAAAGRRS